MKKETKYISILASAIFSISLILLLVPFGGSGLKDYASRSNEFSDYYWGNTATMFGFGSVSTSISFEFEDEDNPIVDETMFNFLKDSYDKFNYIDSLGSTEKSELSVNNIFDINETPINESIEINEELYTILQNSETLFDISNGIFDVTAGKMFAEIDAYTKGADSYDVAQYATGFNTAFEDRLLLEEVDSKYYATRTHTDTMVDLGGYLKGYFTEYVRGIASKYFPENDREIFINSGGSSMTYIGSEVKEMTIASPRDEVKCLVVGDAGCPGKWIDQSNWHVSTSGDYNKFKMDGDTRVHHLVDPRDASFVQDRGLVSIMSNEFASYLDALSSIIFVADPSEYNDILNQLDQDIEVVYLTVNDTQDDFAVDYLSNTGGDKFEVGSRYLPREVA